MKSLWGNEGLTATKSVKEATGVFCSGGTQVLSAKDSFGDEVPLLVFFLFLGLSRFRRPRAQFRATRDSKVNLKSLVQRRTQRQQKSED